MPLVVPGLMSSDKNSNDADSWMSRLAGKKIGDISNETTFAKTELPAQHRVLKPGDMATMDFNPDRVNVHLNKDDTVEKVTKG